MSICMSKRIHPHYSLIIHCVCLLLCLNLFQEDCFYLKQYHIYATQVQDLNEQLQSKDSVDNEVMVAFKKKVEEWEVGS